MDKEKLMEIKNLKKYFPVGSSGFFQKPAYVQAVDDVTFDIYKGETLGIVGESGCGKSTMGRLLVTLLDSTSGEILFEGKEVHTIRKSNRKDISKNIQIIFQDPYASLNPRMTIGDIIREPMRINGIASGDELEKKLDTLLSQVGLASYHKDRYPHEFSGGQRQRVGIARAISVNPKLIVCDEAVSALDVSIQAQILNLLDDLQKDLGFTYLFIAHGLNVVKHISDRVGVMYLGKLVELAEVDKLYSTPMHPYTQALLSAIPIPNPEKKKERIILTGDVPSPINPPAGCRFHTRCSKCMDVCKQTEPLLVELESGHKVACHLYNK
ncbi:peptide/nickel transport system ATP-binding protein/oligopeptide transport system ATP-binding protein [Clostridium saccharoperbutylacetonicum]|uniref:Oligopeptide transport ATP-binding protein AppF n=1 Tax=Clostridium saccharoperbutylacetonicum N1-4(HMT) TaxID=931276 RepID=M1MGU8_9CLOT|nr:dipeptide ABC transporter ATP-binding protein [Clostridium saccharoperbutylacetonicum]AGF54176.1 oligopeptide transport ATP-binding protein AppF [Clostridium saccharoperbutylacetonicum N1-4(HMT)]NRT59310.1 peptide/nickel transport system ATP-binding protein/oligopeptide transport system ATP-binding protein [Clostridium saccharoperbutylacetonicum]NSB28501.1 peptide/nickel transport system ATP-binding protein/oligopeptide transport system ATP-binding protein [Clostridium saccharoperbutylacetoni